MSSVVVVGSQWGDEGKGKVVDWLSERADVIVRFQGGHNAGHTLVIDGVTYKLSLLPSGVVRGSKLSIIGNGVVVDPWALLKEIESVTAQGVSITSENLKIAENACLILPIHQKLDHAAEALRGKEKIGTTGRGIGPAYEDKVGRRAIRFCDLHDEASLKSKIENMLAHHNIILKAAGEEEVTADSILEALTPLIGKLLPHVAPTWRILAEARKAKKHILFEGAQGIMLDVDHGTYPYVTSSNTTAGGAATGSGFGPLYLDYVLGITKAYTTRVGGGPFPTELFDETGRYLAEKGHEFGATTGRARRCGWFDAVLVRQSCKINGINGVALTKLDVLDGFDELKVCIGYKFNGEMYDRLPAGTGAQAGVEPVYETFEGWSGSTAGARSWADLPAQAVKYVRRIEELIETPVALLSTSPERDDTILMQDPFKG